MTENQNDQRNQQSDSKSNQQSTENSSASTQGKSNINVQDTEKGEDIEEENRRRNNLSKKTAIPIRRNH